MPYVFAYGISTDPDQMKRDLGDVDGMVRATLTDYIYTFTGEHPDFDDGGTSTLVPLKGGQVLGVAYQVSENRLEDLVKNGHGYVLKQNRALIEGVERKVYTLEPQIIQPYNLPSADYIRRVRKGLNKHYPEKMVDLYLRRALKRTSEVKYKSIDRPTREKFNPEYGADFRRLFPSGSSQSSPFGAAWAVLSPGKHTLPHCHDEEEAFLFMEGTGTMNVDEHRLPVSKGDVVYLEPFAVHTVKNEGSKDMEILCIWWGETSEK
ncbi:cupin domain-containing protein [Melghirimyces algeriensis]|uniref:Cupin domain-containing protein n=1 Tax=Melghirimyces algeriensis TaxID=910412 RepID=A0A521D591_9BACL|nr:cupin domain-containing protein [Melghirimyces algeriensis]SMO66873.1 Cupin domain-containing protein [Melghirimyces algeriensis]